MLPTHSQKPNAELICYLEKQVGAKTTVYRIGGLLASDEDNAEHFSLVEDLSITVEQNFKVQINNAPLRRLEQLDPFSVWTLDRSQNGLFVYLDSPIRFGVPIKVRHFLNNSQKSFVISSTCDVLLGH